MTIRAEVATAMVQLYRGELGRMTASRRRLDTTTSWAISLAGAVATLALGSDSIPHLVILLGMPLILALLLLEADHYRSFRASYTRVRMIERGFFAETLGGQADATWQDGLLAQLLDPRPPLDHSAAVGWRLRRVYRWVFLGLLLSWLLKLVLSGGSPLDPAALIARAAVPPVPGWLVVVAVLAFYAWLVRLAALAPQRFPRDEEC